MSVSVFFESFKKLRERYTVSSDTVYTWIRAGAPCLQTSGRNGRRLFPQPTFDHWVRKSYGAGDWGDTPTVDTIPSRTKIRSGKAQKTKGGAQ